MKLTSILGCQYQANVSVSVSDMFGALSQLNIQPYDILEYTRSLDSFNLPYTVRKILTVIDRLLQRI